MSVKVAPTVAGEVAVWTGVRAVTRVGQHVAVKISFSDERTSANAALEPHLQDRKQASVSSASSRYLATKKAMPTEENWPQKTEDPLTTLNHKIPTCSFSILIFKKIAGLDGYDLILSNE